MATLTKPTHGARHFMVGLALALGIGAEFVQSASAQNSPMVLKSNMAVLNAAMPTEEFRFVGSNAPGQVFYADEAVNAKFVFKKGGRSGAVDFQLELQEISTREPGKVIEGMEGFSDTAGHAPLIGLEGKPILHPLKVTFDDKPEAAFEVPNLPIPKRYGTYAVILVEGAKRQFLATVCRVIKPAEGGDLENTPILGDFGLFDKKELYATRAACYQRMGVHGMRLETSWSEDKEGVYHWENLDSIFDPLVAHQIKLMVTLGGHSGWMWPFNPKQSPAVVPANWDGNPYGGQSDWLCSPKLYPQYGRWITALCERYWKGGNGALWGLENYNEPWEGGGISGWARDAVQYREIQKTIAEAARKVDKRIKLCAASSIMNTEDKLYADGSNEFDKYVDVFTDHYVVPPMCYGPLVAQAHGKESQETETWFVNAEYMLPQIMQFLASGQKRLVPWHPRVLFDKVPGVDDNYFIPVPLIAANAAFNHFLTGKPFEKVVFKDHLPWVFQFGKDEDKSGMLVMFGQLMDIGGENPKEMLWSQVQSAPGGTITIDNADGLLKFFDLAGNPAYVGEKSVTIPLTIFPAYISCDQGPKVAGARIAAAKMDGKRPVEILPRDFTTRVDAKGARFSVELHNCVNRAIDGKISVKSPDDITLGMTEQPVKLAAGETKAFIFPISAAKPNSANAYPFSFKVESDAGNAEYAEIMNAAIAVKGTRTIDGNLDDWKDVPGVTVIAKTQKAEVTENLRRPWLELKDKQPDGSFGEFKVSWDEKFLYLAARINDKTPQADSPGMEGRDEDAYFHTSKDDQVSPYKEFLKEFPGRSFGEVPYVYRYSPEKPATPDLPVVHFRRDRLQVALDVSSDWHDLKPDTDKVPRGFHAVPDTDYEYALYLCTGGKSELWRLLAPGVPRRADFPRTPKGERSTGPVRGAQHVVKRDGNVYIYEAAIPREEIANLKLTAGTNFGLMMRGGNNDGPHVDYGTDKAVTKLNGLTLHPYWERASNCGVRWTLVE